MYFRQRFVFCDETGGDYQGSSSSSSGGDYSAGGSGGTGLIAGMFAMQGQSNAQAWSAQQSRDARDFAVQQQSREFEFNREMQSNAMNWADLERRTAHQAEVGDLEAAGLNPMLSVMRGGASTPGAPMASGSAGSSPGPAPFPGNPQGAISSALSAATTAAAVDKIMAETRNVDADTKLKSLLGPKAEAETRQSSASAELLSQQVDEVKQSIAKMSYEMDLLKQQERTSQQDELLKQMQTHVESLKGVLASLEVPGATARAKSWMPGGVGGFYSDTLRPYLKDVLSGAATAIQFAK